MTKQIAITLERYEVHSTVQHFDNPLSGHATSSEDKIDRVYYRVTKLRNAAVIDFGSDGPNRLRKIHVGSELNEAQAQEVASMKRFDVTITE